MPLLRIANEGRGRAYTTFRGVMEAVLRAAYVGDWPAKAWGLLPFSVDVEETHLTLPVLPAGAAPMRLGFISDIHVGPTTPRALLDAAFGKLADAKLDVLLLGGDYVFLDATEEKAQLLASYVDRVPARRKLGVLGNHDLWTRQDVIEAALRRVGVEMLLNESLRVGDLTVVGVDDPWTGKPDAHRAFEGVGDANAILVLCHSPDGLPLVAPFVESLPSSVPVAYICGHTHGGHVATPWGPIVVPGPMGRKYPRGMHRVGPIQLYVSRGVGGIEVPVRTYAQPEVVVLDLVAKR